MKCIQWITSSVIVSFLLSVSTCQVPLSVAAELTGDSKRETPTLSTQLVEASPRGLEFRIHLPTWRVTEVQTEAGSFQRIVPPQGNEAILLGGMENISLPEVPVLSTLIAVPIGGEIKATEIIPEGNPIIEKVRLYPVQRPTRAATGKQDEDRFEFDKLRYDRGVSSIKRMVRPLPLSQTDVNVQKLAVNLVDYDPGQEVMTYYPSIRVRVLFSSEENCFQVIPQSEQFKMDRVDTILEKSKQPLLSSVINAELFSKNSCFKPQLPVSLGTRLLIITPQDLSSAAQTLKNHKIAMGISTRVVSTQTISNQFGDGSGKATDVQIQHYLKNVYDTSFIRPRWVLLMGDAEFIPTHYTDQQNSYDPAKNAGDQFYGQLDDNPLSISSFGIGRLSVDSLEQAQIIVNKIVNYEVTPPPFLDGFYHSLTFASYFQDDDANGTDDRWFVETTESIRNHLLGKGLTPKRIYTTGANINPKFYYDGTPIPTELQKPDFPWNGKAADIIAAANAGSSLIYHRDHGWWDGWGDPSFDLGSLDAVSVPGHKYPVVFSINCASGMFDNETVDLPANMVGLGYGPNPGSTYWAEKFLRKADGAIAVIGDTRSSSTVLNNTMAKGLFDAIWADYLPMGGAASIRRLGDVLNHAKTLVGTSAYAVNDVKQENTIYNLLGDPTVRVLSDNHWKIILDAIKAKLNLIEISIRLVPPKCLTCPPNEVPKKEPIFAVVQEAKTGRLLGRTVVSGEGNVSIPIEDAQGELRVTLSAGDMLAKQTLVKVE